MTSLNARAGAVALLVGAGGGLALNLENASLTPALVACLALTGFGVWSFADEMGLRRPLNRAGLVAFLFAAWAKGMVLMSAEGGARFAILYVFALLVALLLWSIALLHRGGVSRVFGAFGAMGALTPILLLVVGHLFIGAAALFGIAALFGAASPATAQLPIVRIVEGVLLAWAALVSALLWTGRIRTEPASPQGRADAVK